ncbi:PREDICTED: microsomal triglyceride transfer protein large subunit [Bactrocera latifrons]|uniref:Microsomal triglyceride transfer protein large subunit n=1 Tax=Bactrocera latifrons TaxID=174628 RepID=A0A0K8UTX2_BACLA|nr:PREDICTED: microsomal triglyceride transfer protein large subunit [Bactrocera latifrons]
MCSKQMWSRRIPALLLLFCVLVPTTFSKTAFLIPPKSQHFFELTNVVSMHDLSRTSAEEASYILRSQLKVNSVWNTERDQLLEVFITYSKLSAPAKARKSSKNADITKIPDRPFYVSLVAGKPHKVIAHTSRDQSLLNLERGFASLLLLQYQNGPVTEVDVSGKCNAFYAVKSSTNIEKIKTDCSHWDLKVNYRAEKALGITQVSQEIVEYELSAEGALMQAISSEKHRIGLAAKPDVGSEVSAKFSLTHLVESADEVKQLEFDKLDDAVESLLEWYRVFDIEADVDGAISEIKDTTLKNEIENFSADFTSENVGKQSLARAIAELLPVARITKQPEFVEILKSHKESVHPAIDLLAAVQTIDAHNAITEIFNFNGDDDVEFLEQYLQSLAVGTHPERAIIEDLFKRLQTTNENEKITNEKLQDTVIQTVAALTRQSGFDPNDPLLQQIRNYLLDNLSEKCTEIDCKIIYIRALQNLQDVSTIQTLFDRAFNGAAAESVVALQALKSFSIVNFNEMQRRSLAEIFYQNKRKFDSSARVIALDILLALKPTKEQLSELLRYLNSNDQHFEVKTFVIQKLRMVAEKCPRFRALLKSCLAELPEVNNYHVIGQKGLTTVLSRELSQTPAFNETLLSTQEIYQGVLKRGTVELLLGADKDEFSSFKIGIYTSGLSSFVGDEEDVPEDEADDSPATAGMELTVQGILLRPLVFFSGQGELMGHVWSGTASDPTPAYQATILAEDHEHYVILASGATVYMRVVGTRSIDLNGKVEFSLWNRNANTLIKQNTGAAVVGRMVAGFTYAKVENKFTLTSEPQISLQADIDFYSGVKLCMKLERPDLILNLSNTKSVYLTPSSYYKHIRTKSTHKLAGRTLALNQKNNEMCNLIFSD